MHLVKDDTSSLLLLRDTDSYLSRHSILSDSSSMLNVSFEFDREVFNSKAYQVAIRSALSRKKGKMPQRQAPPLNDAIDVVDHQRFNNTEDDAQTLQSKPMDPWLLNDENSNGIIKSSDQADAILVTREQKDTISQRQKSFLNDVIDVVGYERVSDTEDDTQTVPNKTVDSWFLNDAIEVVGYERFNDTEDDGQTLRKGSLDPWPLNDAGSNGIIRKSNQANDAVLITQEQKGKTPQRQNPSLNHAIGVLGYGHGRFHDIEDDARTVRSVRRKSVNSWSSGDDIAIVGYERSKEIENDAQTIESISVSHRPLNDAIPSEIIKNPTYPDNTVFINRTFGGIIGHSTSPWEVLASSNVRAERGDIKIPSTDKRRPMSQNPVYTNHASAMIKKASVKIGVPLSSPITTEQGHKSMSTKNISSQSPLSSVTRQHLQKSPKVLILGSSGAGKSTLLKSMIICCEGGLCSRNDRKRYKDIIYCNLIEDLQKIFDAMTALGLDSVDKHDHFLTIKKAANLKPDELSDHIASAIKAFWNDSDVQKCFGVLHSCRLNDPSG